MSIKNAGGWSDMDTFEFRVCPRCGARHKETKMRRLKRPIVIGDHEWWMWAPCPTTGEPMLVQDRDWMLTLALAC